VGLYSVIAYNVTQRTHEIGVRVALGAQARDVAGLVVGDGFRVTVVGVAIGGAVALWAGRWVKALLFDVSPYDPTVFGLVAATLVAAGVAASWLPARRATRVDPNVVLRAD
jgi:putative ABC transport system permease protein